MYDKELLLETLIQIHKLTETILFRFEPVKNVFDFTDSPAGMEKLDSICMPLIAIGESLKKLDKITEGELFKKYPEIEWKKAIGMRNIISHQYFDIDAEAVFQACNIEIPRLANTIEKMIEDNKKGK
ncbi:MAG: HepT-like ribonuclease domain-containing protein [bacterium]